jgi:hypothetical protein
MTGSPQSPAPHRETGTEDANDHLATLSRKQDKQSRPPCPERHAPNSAAVKAPYGRYAVGLRPSLDPDAYFGAPSKDKEARRTNQNNTEVWS